MKNLTVYSKNNCAQCKMLKKQLDAKSITYKEINLDEEPDFIPVVKELGYSAAPVVVYGEDFHFYGFNPAKVRELISLIEQ